MTPVARIPRRRCGDCVRLCHFAPGGGRDVAMPDPCGLHRQPEVERELSAVVALQLPDRKGHRVAELAEERETGIETESQRRTSRLPSQGNRGR